MKIRIGFVSNSSSSCFIIDKRHISAHQKDLIYNHIEESRKREREGTYSQHAHCVDEWDISETETHIRCFTWMDNFDLRHYLIEVVGLVDAEIGEE